MGSLILKIPGIIEKRPTSFKNFDLQKNINKTDTTIVAPAPPIVTVH